MNYHKIGVLIIILILASFNLANAATVETIHVNPLGSAALTIDLDGGQRVSGSISITGGSNDDINFFVRNPEGNTILDLGRIYQGDTFEFTATISGAYEIYFENTFSIFTGKTVTLTFDVESPSIIRVDSLVLVVIVIIVLISLGIGVYLYRREKPPEKLDTTPRKDAPSDVMSYLTSDENLLKNEKSAEWEVYVTDKRVIFKKGGILGKELVEASYRHISSIEYKKGSPFSLILTGIIFIVLGVIQYNFLHGMEFIGTISLALLIIFILLGILSIVASFFIKPTYKIHVVGREPLSISGKFEGIIKIIRQYREKVETESTRK